MHFSNLSFFAFHDIFSGKNPHFRHHMDLMKMVTFSPQSRLEVMILSRFELKNLAQETNFCEVDSKFARFVWTFFPVLRFDPPFDLSMGFDHRFWTPNQHFWAHWKNFWSVNHRNHCFLDSMKLFRPDPVFFVKKSRFLVANTELENIFFCPHSVFSV